MAAELGWAGLGIAPDMTGFDRSLGRQLDPALTKVGRDSGKRFGGILGKAAAGAAAGAVGAGLLAFKLGKDAIGQASDLNESLNAVNVSYGKQAKAVQALGREAADTLGLSNVEFNSLSVRFSAFAKTIAGGGGKKVVGTLDDLTTRASDFASVMNLEVNEAAELFQSGLAGETEPLRKFGIDLSAAKVEAFAYASGIAKTGEELTESEKVQARYGALMAQTAQAQGDFANTSDELANKQRITNARWDDAQAKLGTALLPLMSQAVDVIADDAIPAFEDFSDWFASDGLPALQNFADRVQPLAEDLLPAAGDALGVMKDAGEKLLPIAEDIVGAFNDMPKWAQALVVGGAAGGLLGKKLNIFGGKSGGLLGSGPGSAKNPLYVIPIGGLGKNGKPGGPVLVPDVDGPDKDKPGRHRKTSPKKPSGGPSRLNFLEGLLFGEFTGLIPDGPAGRAIEGGLVGGIVGKNPISIATGTYLGLMAGAVEDVHEANERWRKFRTDFDKQARENIDSGAVRDQPFTWNMDAFGNLQVDMDNNFSWEKFLPSDADVDGFLKIKDALSDDLIAYISTQGVPETKKDLRDVVAILDDDLDKRQVKTLIKVLGIDKAMSDIDRLMDKWNAWERMTGSDNIVPDLPGPGRSNQGGQVQGTGTNTSARSSTDPNARSTAPTVAYYGDVTYTDDREGRRRAQQQHQRNQADGVRRGVMA